MGAKGLARAKVGENGEWTQSPMAKSITPEARTATAGSPQAWASANTSPCVSVSEAKRNRSAAR